MTNAINTWVISTEQSLYNVTQGMLTCACLNPAHSTPVRMCQLVMHMC